jgi:predicted GNAT superfamily acetyltransferase
MDKFIVAELSKNWGQGEPATKTIGQQFEKAINTNFQRGYNLKEWKINSNSQNGIFTETIIAIFELRVEYTNFEEIPNRG